MSVVRFVRTLMLRRSGIHCGGQGYHGTRMVALSVLIFQVLCCLFHTFMFKYKKSNDHDDDNDDDDDNEEGDDDDDERKRDGSI